jgi:hypothetical protein
MPNELVARLPITGTTSEISTRLIYNSSDVKTNGTDYFTLNFTQLYLRTRRTCRPVIRRRHSAKRTSIVFF